MTNLCGSSDDPPYDDEALNIPIPFQFITSSTTAALLFSSANFYRTASIANIELIIGQGTDINPGLIWYSANTYLSNSTFNSVNPITEIIWPNSKDALILTDGDFFHDIMIQYKLTKSDNTNYINNREVRATLVNATEMVFNAGIFGNAQPNPGAHDTITFKGSITHNLNDLCKIKLNIVQDNLRSGVSDSKLTIFRISWNIFGLKNE